MSDCPECDEPMIWGGMSWHPHSDRQHAATRARLTRYAARLLRERSAVLAGHRVTVRFTAAAAWFECACGERGQVRRWANRACGDGRNHLLNEGTTS